MQTPDRLFTLRNAQNMRLTISERGAALVSWLASDRDGQFADVLLGYPDAQGYVENKDYFGAIVGRWANRIKNGTFMLDGNLQQVTINDRGNHLHGGTHGFFQSHWQGSQTDEGLTFRLTSPAGDAGFPGNLEVWVHYQLKDDGSLMIYYEATCDAPTAINLTSHPYFNLNCGTGDIGAHLLQIDADYYMKNDASGIASDLATVQDTPFDFRQCARIGSRLGSDDEQIKMAHGFDHYFCVRLPGQGDGATLHEVARVVDPGSGRTLEMSTTEAGLQFYSGNYLDGVPGRGVQHYRAYAGFCLEAHACPDQINGPYAAQTILRPGQTYRQTTVYRLGITS